VIRDYGRSSVAHLEPTLNVSNGRAIESSMLLLLIRRRGSTVIASPFVDWTLLENWGAEVQTYQHLIISRVMRTDLSWYEKTHVQLAFRVINGCSHRPPQYPISLMPPSTPLHSSPPPRLPFIQPPTTISTAPSTAPPLSTTSPTLPHRLLIHSILTQRVRILSILNATAAVDRARRSVFIVVSAEVAVIEIAVAAIEVDAFFVAHCAWE